MMITYDSNYFGFKQLLQLNGSAVYRTLIPSTISTIILVVIIYTSSDNQTAQQRLIKDNNDDDNNNQQAADEAEAADEGYYYDISNSATLSDHPFIIGIYIMIFSLLLNHRLNYCYQRYWESCGHLFLMTSNWMDSATTLASFHYQSVVYNEESRPQSFGNVDVDVDDDDENGENTNCKKNSNKSAPKGGHRHLLANHNHKHNHNHNHKHKHRRPSALLRNRRSQMHSQRKSEDGNGSGIIGHQRKPSTDIPTSNCVVKSFTPHPCLEWQKQNRVVMPRNTGLHSTAIKQFDGDFDDLLLLQKEEEENNNDRRLLGQQQHQQGGGGLAGIQHRRASLPSMKFPMPELFDLPSLHKKLLPPVGGNVLDSFVLDSETATATAASNSNNNSNNGVHFADGTGGPKRNHPNNRSSNRSSLTSSSSSSSSLSSSSMIGSSHSSTNTNTTTTAGDKNNRGQQQLETSVEDMNGRASLFLQEAAHLFSLMSAVAMASLRADMEGCASPLVDYVPGQKFPPVNPEEMKIKILVREAEKTTTTTPTKVDKENASCSSLNIESELDDNFNNTSSNRDNSLRSTASSQTQQLDSTTIRIKRNNAVTNVFLFLFGMSRNARQRTIYNASRPFSVLGGVSNQEVEMLRKVRGHAAQHALCAFWLREFITREHLSGSTGNIDPSIMSRVYQYISDGSQQYHQCRKTAFTDFPFPHAQLTSFFVLVSILVFPFLCYTYVTNVWIAMALNFLTTSCFVGIQEVAMELEEPFIRYPNDLPLNNYQAQFNEALISSLYGGFHPDSWGHAHDDGGTSSDYR